MGRKQPFVIEIKESEKNPGSVYGRSGFFSLDILDGIITAQEYLPVGHPLIPFCEEAWRVKRQNLDLYKKGKARQAEITAEYRNKRSRTRDLDKVE